MWLNDRAAELLREVIRVDDASETPTHILAFVTALPTPAGAPDTAQAVKGFHVVKARSQVAIRQHKLDDMWQIALIHPCRNLALAAGHWS